MAGERLARVPLIYPVVGHWIWGGGWLASLGMWDFAGSTVVHSTGGWLAFAGAAVLGPRLGKYRADGKPNPILGHNIPLTTLGVFILWFGWFGFNPGSTMAANISIAHIAVTTNLAAAAGALAAMFTVWIMFGKPDTSMTLNGALGGLVAITAPCAFVSAGSSIIIGIGAGVLVVLSVVFVERTLKVDDPVGTVSVHAVCGSFGTLALGLFAEDVFSPGTTGDGLLFGGGASLLVHQAVGVFAVFAWCMVTGFALFLALKATIGIRVTAEEEEEGLDIGEHGAPAYPDFQSRITPASRCRRAAAGVWKRCGRHGLLPRYRRPSRSARGGRSGAFPRPAAEAFGPRPARQYGTRRPFRFNGPAFLVLIRDQPGAERRPALGCCRNSVRQVPVLHPDKPRSSVPTSRMRRRDFLRLTGAAGAALALSGCGDDGTVVQPTDDGEVAHILATASSDRIYLKVSLQAPPDATPELRVDGHALRGIPTDSSGRFWAFDARDLVSQRAHTLVLRIGRRAITAPWLLTTLPAPNARPQHVRHPGLHLRRRP
ncbi:MAG: ammonium transporter [bacterium]